MVSTYQAISGAGKTFETWPEILDNVVPYIGGKEEKSEIEPLKIWGEVTPEGIKPAAKPVFTAQCIRVPVTDGHLATVFVDFARKPSKEEILLLPANFAGEPQKRNLPSAPQPFLRYFEEDNRPQTGLDRDWQTAWAFPWVLPEGSPVPDALQFACPTTPCGAPRGCGAHR